MTTSLPVRHHGEASKMYLDRQPRRPCESRARRSICFPSRRSPRVHRTRRSSLPVSTKPTTRPAERRVLLCPGHAAQQPRRAERARCRTRGGGVTPEPSFWSTSAPRAHSTKKRSIASRSKRYPWGPAHGSGKQCHERVAHQTGRLRPLPSDAARSSRRPCGLALRSRSYGLESADPVRRRL